MDDRDADEVGEHALKMNCKAQLYVEHYVKVLFGLEPGIELGQSSGVLNGAAEIDVDYDESVSDSHNSEDEVDGVKFDDSEDERALGLDDGFGVDNTIRDSSIGSYNVKIQGLNHGKPYSMKTTANRSIPKKTTKNMEIVPVLDNYNSNIEMEYAYASEELDNSDPDSNSNKEKRPKYDQFRVEELNKNYKFKLGLEFKSLVEFKDAIREWSILNGKEIEFIKNDSIRARVICKAKCWFLALVSKVGDSHTFRMKKWCGDHTCGRILNNSSANSKWIAKFVANKLSSCDNMQIRETLSGIRRIYFVGITTGRAWKASQIANEIVEGDAAKQYTFLWRYFAKLRRASVENTCKINIDRPCLTLQPRFSSFYFCFDDSKKKGFLRGCRPFIGVDGCHLKTKYGGTLLFAVGRDPNDQYFPLAFGVVETKTKESWRWFLTLLHKDIGQEKRWVFISNQQKVL
uniref:Uncharacterized protein LOC101510316 n=1 Tax=Cicer arietinum TaxID=3827 RepID=A0A1S2XK43_CICAR|nr:uncharacterized protein LOC101510316 [Cicer arietinum]